MNKITTALLILGTGFAMRATAQSRILPVLEGTTDARTAAMGGTMLGNTDQMHIYTNPAGLTFGERKISVDASIEAQPKTDDGRLTQYNLSAGYQFKNRSALMGGVRYLGGLTVPVTGTHGEAGSISPYNIALDLGYSFSVTPEIAVYATTTYARDHAATHADAWAFSVGAGYQKAFSLSPALPTHLTFGARLMDFGKSVKFDDTGIPQSLPTSVVLGGDWKVDIARQHAVTYALSYRYFTPKEAHETLLCTGLEYTYRQMVSARIGYCHADKGSDALTFGAGGELAGIRLDVAYHHAFASYGMNTFTVGLGYAF